MKNTQLISPNSTFVFTVSNEYNGTRLDKYLAERFTLYSRSFLQGLITNNQVILNNKIVNKPGAVLKTNDTITVSFPAQESPEKITASNIPTVDIIAEHEHFLILNKPAGLMVHSPNKKSMEF